MAAKKKAPPKKVRGKVKKKPAKTFKRSTRVPRETPVEQFGGVDLGFDPEARPVLTPLSIEERLAGGRGMKPIRMRDAREMERELHDLAAQRKAELGLMSNRPTPEGTLEARQERAEERKAVFLDTLRSMPLMMVTPYYACLWLAAHDPMNAVTTRCVQKWRNADTEFDAEVEQAIEDVNDRLDAEFVRRGVEGYEEPVFGSLGPEMGNGVIGYVTKYSDPLLIDLRRRRSSVAKARTTRRELPTPGVTGGVEFGATERVARITELLNTARERMAGHAPDSSAQVGANKQPAEGGANDTSD